MLQEFLTTPLINDGNLRNYYRFEGNANDVKGNNNGSGSNITYSTGNGKFSQGAGFNGLSSKINVGQIYSGSGDFSINVWIKTATTGVRQTIISQGAASTNNGFFFRVSTSNQLQFELYSGAINSSVSVVTDGNWHMVTVTVTSGVCKLYVDAVLETFFSVAPINISVSSDFPYIGVEQASNWFNGAMDDFIFLNRALSSLEVKKLYEGFSSAMFLFM